MLEVLELTFGGAVKDRSGRLLAGQDWSIASGLRAPFAAQLPCITEESHQPFLRIHSRQSSTLIMDVHNMSSRVESRVLERLSCLEDGLAPRL